jgi:hypothetical protein
MVRCQAHLKNVETHNGVENDLQGIEKGRDGEMIIFFLEKVIQELSEDISEEFDGGAPGNLGPRLMVNN